MLKLISISFTIFWSGTTAIVCHIFLSLKIPQVSTNENCSRQSHISPLQLPLNLPWYVPLLTFSFFLNIPLNLSSATICSQKCGKIILACARGCFSMCDLKQARFVLCKEFFTFRCFYFYSTGMDGKKDLMASESLSHLQPKNCYNATLHRLRMLLKCSLPILTFWKFVLKNKEYGNTIKSQNTKIYIII